MKLLRIKAYQLFAHYRKPFSYSFWDTYPLPSLSNVVGWFHSVVEAKEYIPMSVSIQGEYSSIVYDLQILTKFDKKSNAKGNPILEDFKKALSKSPIYVANVFDIHLIIYIKAEEKFLNRFIENVYKVSYPSLGRYEDLLRIDDKLEIIEPEKQDLLYKTIIYPDRYGIYLNKDTAKKLGLDGINYRMDFKYKKVKDVRYFEKKDVVYIEGLKIPKQNFTVLVDKEENKIIDLIGDKVE